MHIGLYFGSFNPIHLGHLIVASQALAQTRLDRLWLVVSPHNPLKKKDNLLSEYDRLRMVELAIEGNHAMQASNVEFFLPNPSYTVDTLLHLREKYPSYTFSIVMGADNLQHLHKWKNYEAILNNYTLYVYPRNETMPNSAFDTHPNVHIFQAPLLDISATFIRESIEQGRSIRYLVPDSVQDYIETRRLYR
jgi:nicotinate-nucleotide adenylyltransferase